MNKIILNTISDDKVIVRKAAENGGNAGGDNGGSTASSWEYYDISNLDTTMTTVGIMSQLNKARITNSAAGMKVYIIQPPYSYDMLTKDMEGVDGFTIEKLACAVDMNAATFHPQYGPQTMREFFDSQGLTEDKLIPYRITKEEFYNTTV